MSVYDTDLTVGVAMLLADHGHGTWDPEGVYQPGETGIVLDLVPQTPDDVITLSAYGVDDDVTEGRSVVGVQIRNRATAGDNPRPARELAAAIFTTLHGRTQITLATGLRVHQINRASWTSGGQDSNRRWSMIQNFYADIYIPAKQLYPPGGMTP
ncbi:hypothetical protein D9V41_09230 [Aeromicrobium phragmitis]|uniref:DUF3168 domain-containing protein n=1 Tax=Aeromicrobium phragmitis TaxID=2478914 RepID=A0A3L8PLC7_9ACTN|nr:minor capsid protein [Aeromicrobium phragmitis]RLV56060.1 hypothetical protein D9V41_09230 [Aeromicrobium phragmitis]